MLATTPGVAKASPAPNIFVAMLLIMTNHAMGFHATAAPFISNALIF
jgi:hypothetical protein